jgi:hypothetical protein
MRANANNFRSFFSKPLHSAFVSFSSIFLIIILFLFSACRSSQKADMRIYAPSNAVAYLEIKDLSQTLNALTENKVFHELAKNKMDFSALEDIQVAIIVTDFETSEKQVIANDSILNFKPHFVAVAETHAWQWQTLSLVENQITNFVRETYGGDAKFETSDKNGGKWFVWTAKDGRKVFAFVQNSQIYFGNDDNAIEKCLAVKRGEADSLAKNENFIRAYSVNDEKNLAFGYISPVGIAQIANIIGISTAIKTTEESEGRSFIARVLPQILQNTTKEILWTAQKSEQGIEDIFFVSLTTEASSIFKETLISPTEIKTNAAEFLPSDVFSVTRYSLKNPLIAWRSLLLVTAKNTDAVSGNLLIQFSGSLLEPYGVSDVETFLSAVNSEILTARFDAKGENSVAIIGVKDAEKIKKSIAGINFKSQSQKQENAEIWKSDDGETAAAFVENILILGDAESVFKSLQVKQTGQNFTKNLYFQSFAESRAVAVTFAKNTDSAEKIVKILGTPNGRTNVVTTCLTETRFTEKGIERKITSPFGLFGTILEKIRQ